MAACKRTSGSLSFSALMISSVAGSTFRIASSRTACADRKSTRLNSSHTEIYTLSLHDALPIYGRLQAHFRLAVFQRLDDFLRGRLDVPHRQFAHRLRRSEEHTSELQSHRDLHSFPTRRSSDLWPPASALPARCLSAP